MSAKNNVKELIKSAWFNSYNIYAHASESVQG